MIKKFSAMILAAGYGKRLLPLTNEIPKPLIEINNISLLQNTIDFLFRIGCSKIVINTHFKHALISEFIENNFQSSNIFISYEENILDTGGAVKNAIPFFDDEAILVTNSDIFWKKENEKNVIDFISNFNLKDKCKLLLVPEIKANGIKSTYGDFSLKNKIVTRWKKGQDIIFYSGLQMLKLDILNDFKEEKFSFNSVWDLQIYNNSLYGELMDSKWYHVGDFDGLNKAISSIT
tara:strand:+ start:61 stop:762 length:702 start_codon:yes stop_codon:yes gene_type:complete